MCQALLSVAIDARKAEELQQAQGRRKEHTGWIEMQPASLFNAHLPHCFMQWARHIQSSPHSQLWKLIIATEIWEWKGDKLAFQINHSLLKEKKKKI